ncbi:MAG: signal peptidase I [Clostridium sp.]|uniref:signal peptidase I n=1 Tax=Clostridium innocuum TaxID=1522 RepID=UPI001AF921B8|nr:signal peptidase I [[Clostridium] innocuum]QSI26695.1 signal peptidase I [Erysipelotrichaceae bacterium 66202529]MCC2832923.1 signal peptidase I [[Clostridium] innocuum]MCR0248118.1 signal peptidase I [[Clostridium] innocuum]MCR0260620.1 signal peptidase I [[Clostridium] innocuum]MCR0393608.1 signal peptidase I [[Clostridium] innocuum]
MRNIITKAGTLVLGILVCLLIIILGIQAYNKLIVRDETAGILGYNYKTVLTGSMEPAIPVGSIVITKEQSSYEIEDIISFQEEGAIITHRIITIDRERYITKGDANNVADTEEVQQKQILGKVILTIPLLGYLVMWLMSPVGIISLFIIIGIWYIATGRNRGAGNEKE